MIHDLVDHDRPDFGVGIGRTWCGAKLSQGRRVIHAKSSLSHGGIFGTEAGREPAERDAVFAGAKTGRCAVTGEIADAVGGGNPDFVSARRIKRKRGGGVVGIELVLIENHKGARRQERAVRYAVFFEILPRVADEPAADVDGGRCRIKELDSVFERRVGMSQSLVNDKRGERKKIAFRRSGDWEVYDRRGPVEQPTLRNVGELYAKIDDVNERQVT